MPLYVLTWQKLSCLDTSCSFHDMIPSSNWNGTSNVQLLRDVLVQQKPRGVSLDMALLLHEANEEVRAAELVVVVDLAACGE